MGLQLHTLRNQLPPVLQTNRILLLLRGRFSPKFFWGRRIVKTNPFNRMFDACFPEIASPFVDDAHPSAWQSSFGLAGPSRFGWQGSMDFA